MIGWLKRSHFRWYQGPMIVWAAALFIQSSIPSTELPSWEILTHDKLLHFLVYVIFAAAVHRAIVHQERFPLLARRAYLFTILLVALYGASDEFHQYFVPGRECSLKDWIADCLGAVVFVGWHWAKTKLRLRASEVS